METEKPKKNTGIRRLFKACLYSYDGIKSALKNEAAFRQEICLAAVLFAALFFLDATCVEKILMSGSVFLLLIVELLNSAVEECVNLCTQKIHPLAKRAKDMGSAAVLFAIANLIAVWGIVLWRVFF
ncbi:MAG: diacylglycerol kinase [Opitutales bacterium]|nr:diacylglycerol kinase [Opitutales bacterium]